MILGAAAESGLALESKLALGKYYGLSLIGLCVLLFFPALGARDFWAPGEPIYAETLRVMFEKGEWIVPTLNGQLFPDKPVLYYWLALIVSKVAGGVSEWTVRVPTALGGTGLVLVTYLIGKTFFDRRAGFLSAVILATSYRVFWESRFLRLDTVLSFFLLLGLYLFLKAFIEKRSSGYYLLAYASFALATLTKGPLGLVLPGFTVLCVIAVTGRWQELRRMHLIAGAMLVATILAPWLLLLHQRGQDQWVWDFLLIHNVQNYALEPIGHVRPIYYYFSMLPLDFLPWTLLVPGALVFYFPWRNRLRDPAVLALTCWFGVTFAFFSLSKSKIAYYLMPLLPSLALLLGCYLDDWAAQQQKTTGWHKRLLRGSLWLLAAIFLGSGVAAPLLSRKIEPGLTWWAFAVGLVFLFGGVIAVRFLWQQEFVKAFSWIAGSLCGVWIISAIGPLPYFNKYKSPRPLADFVRNEIPLEARVFVFRSTMSDFNYYSRRDTIPVIESQAELDQRLRQVHDAYLLINEKDLKYFAESRLPEPVMEKQVGDRKWFVMRVSVAN